MASPLTSPTSNPSTSSNMRSSNIGKLSLQQQVSSASVVPPQFNHSPMSPQIASYQYIEQHRKFMEHQRQLHDEERALWNTERDELHRRMNELESLIKRLGGQPADIYGAVGGQQSGQTSRSASSTGRAQSTGDEFWRGAGGKSDAHPTRSFSEPAEKSPTVPPSVRQLGSIAEHEPSRRKSVGFTGLELTQSPPEKQDFFTHPMPGHSKIPSGISTIPGDRISASLDGITLKSSGLPPEVVKTVALNSGTPSPRGTPASHSIPSSHTSGDTGALSNAPRPHMIHLPSSGLTAEDLRSKDAGHTPMARMVDDDSAAQSLEITPTVKVSDAEKPLEPAPSRLRPPVERSDSYFPTQDPEEPQDERSDPIAKVDEDPELSGQLTLHGDPQSKENDEFLNNVNTKLLQASSSHRSNSLDTIAETSADSELRKIRSAEGDRPMSKGEDRPGLEGDEPEPRLRMKRSTNFGTAFGAKPDRF